MYLGDEATAAGRSWRSPDPRVPVPSDRSAGAASHTGCASCEKGQFSAPGDCQHRSKMSPAVSGRYSLTERGASFGYNNLSTDFRAFAIMRRLGYPVIFDATHSVQLPGGAGDKSSGQREFVAPLARAAVAAGCEGLFMEVHPDPDKALSDGPNMVPLAEVRLVGTGGADRFRGGLGFGGELHVDS